MPTPDPRRIVAAYATLYQRRLVRVKGKHMITGASRIPDAGYIQPEPALRHMHRAMSLYGLRMAGRSTDYTNPYGMTTR